jgi:KDO2-lipid IV(A) lauroyltransferase
VILNNIANSFPEKTEGEHRRIARQFYRHFTDILAEGVKNLSISKKELLKRFKVRNPELIESLYKAEKNVLLVSGHYNNWEWLITAQNMLFPHQAYGIGMPLSSQFWHQKVNARRERFGMRVIHAKNYREELEKQPSELKAVLVLSDQSPGNARKSYWMDFLNQPTAVLFGTEMMANELNYAVVNFTTYKIKRGFYEMELSLITDNPKSLEWGEITEKHTRKLEHAIREHPEQWLWSHRRWKREIPNDLEELKKEQHEKFKSRYR